MSLLIPKGLTANAVSSIPPGFTGILRDDLTDSVIIFDSNGIISTIPTGTVSSVVGTIDASANPDYPSADAGNVFIISVDGKIGGAAGVEVTKGDYVLCTTTNGGGDEATVGAFFNITEANIDLGNIEITGGTITGITSLKATSLQGLTEADDSVLSTPDRTVAGADAANSTVTSGAGGDDVALGGDGGDSVSVGGTGGASSDAASVGGVGGQDNSRAGVGGVGGGAGSTGGAGGLSDMIGGDGGDSTGVGGNGGVGGDAEVMGGAGGTDIEGSSGIGARGGDASLVPGVGGTGGSSDGNDGFARIAGLKMERTVTGIEAKIGGGQDPALKLIATYSKVTVVASLGDSVTLPEAIVKGEAGEETGVHMIIVNDSGSANSMDAFPFPGDHFENLADDVAISIAPGSNLEVHCFSDGQFDLV